MRRGAWVVAVVASLLVPSAAFALSCAMPQLDLLAPNDGAIDVPTNTRIWIGTRQGGDLPHQGQPGGPNAIELLDAAGTAVPGDEGRLEGRGIYEYLRVFAPAQPLTADAQYTVKVGDIMSRFTVGKGPLTTTPQPPHVLGSQVHEYERSEWGDIFSVTYEVEHAGLVAVLDRERTSVLDPLGPSGKFADLTCVGCFGDTMVLSVGQGLCTSSNWPSGGAGASTKVRFGAFDLAGNFSGWGEEHEAEIPFGCGCGAGSRGMGSAGLGLFGMAALGRRRAR